MKILPNKDSVRSPHSHLIEEKDVFNNLMGDKGSLLFLGKYSLSEVSAVLRKRNFFKEAQKRGLWPLAFHMDASEAPLQRFQIYHKKRDPDRLIVDLKIREGTFRPKATLPEDLSGSRFRFLTMEWLTLQNPLQEFSGDHTPLPGQKHPGLGMGKKVLDLFVYLARVSRLDGLLASPAYFHNALLFTRYFSFINPRKQAEVLAIRKTFSHVPFKQLAWIVHLECLREEKSGPYVWEAEEQVFPLHRALKAYFSSRAYKKKVSKAQKSFRFMIDWDLFRSKQDQAYRIEGDGHTPEPFQERTSE